MPQSMEMISLKIRKLQCAHNLMDCYGKCMKALYFCIKMGKDYSSGDHIRVLENCAFFCATTADHILRSSIVSRKVYEDCSSLCREAVKSCEKFPSDPRMNECRDLCQSCADGCLEISNIEENFRKKK